MVEYILGGQIKEENQDTPIKNDLGKGTRKGSQERIMLSIVFAKYTTREFNSDVAGNILHTDDKLREHMYSYGTGRERTEHDHTNMLT